MNKEKGTIKVVDVSKVYQVYKNPTDRLRELLLWNKSLHEDFWALKKISFEVPKGCTVGFIGRNGSGKSTLLSIVTGTLTPTTGKVELNGRVSSLLELGAGFNPEFTGRENVQMNGAIMGFSKSEMEKRMPIIEEFAEIGKFIDQPVKTYSSGMYVRLAFSAAIHVDPDILIVDEALSVGDLYFQHRSMKKIREFRESGKTILFVSHDLQAVTTLCDTVYWLDEGVVVKSGAPKEVVKDYQTHIHRTRRQATTADAGKSQTGLDSVIEELQNVDGRFGNGQAKILGIQFKSEKGIPNEAASGETITVALSIQANEALYSPIVGLTFRDRLGNIVFASNTNHEEYFLPPVKAGGVLNIQFNFTWPYIAPGNYSISPAIAEGTQGTHIMCDWIDNALIVRSYSDIEVMGLMKLSEVELTHRLID